MRLMVFLIILLVLSAWNWDTHHAQIDSVFYSLPEELRDSLNLSALEQGAIAPDREFKDFKNHHYPPAYDEAKHWLEKMQETGQREASYALGVASHYITDSYAAPHYGPESYKDHKKYEEQASQRYRHVRCGTSDAPLRTMLAAGQQEAGTWQRWLKTKDANIPRQAAEKATQVLFAAINQVFNATCAAPTAYKNERYSLNKTQVIALAGIILFLICLCISVARDLRRHFPIEPNHDSDDDEE